MKTIKTLILVLALSVTFAFGDDGHTGGGGRCSTCTPPPACTENCGSIADAETDTLTGTGTDATDEETSLIDYWSEAFFDLVG